LNNNAIAKVIEKKSLLSLCQTKFPRSTCVLKYADAFGKDAQFAQFYQSLEAYKSSFNKKSDVMVLDPSSDFFKAMRGGAAAGPAKK
jgi:hypothetical protein